MAGLDELVVIASEAKQSIAPHKGRIKKEWIASSQELLAMTESEHAFTLSRHIAPEVCK
jgi:hypothetical protein